MDRRQFLKAAGAAVTTAALPSYVRAAETPQPRPNILWIIAEDLSPDMACYGNPLVKTPNLDKLAAQGARRTNCFANAPVCSAVRSGFMTAMYQTSIGAHNHRSHRDDSYQLPAPVKLITDHFVEAGYFTSNANNLNFDKPGKTDFNFEARRPFQGTDWRQRREGRPFYAQVNLYGTHRPFRPDPENPIDHNKVTLPPYYPDHPIAKRDWANYLEDMQILDRNVGKVLARLEADGLADNTIVFFFGDHGRCHIRGKQFLYDGGIRVPLLIRWPGRIEPGTVIEDLVSLIDLGPTCLNLIGASLPSYMHGRPFMGEGAKPRDYIIAARDRCDETVDRIRCVRTKRFKYIRNFYPDRPYMQFNAYKKRQYPVWTLVQVLKEQGKLTGAQAKFAADTRPPEELYDLQTDPHELTNLADDESYAKTLTEMRNLLDTWLDQTNDKGAIPEDEKYIAKLNSDARGRLNKYLQSEAHFDHAPTDEEYLAFWEKKLALK